MATALPTDEAASKNKPLPPPGLKALIDHLHSIYPDQPNPLQVTTLLKYWLGGHDPLDYISMYHNAGDPERGIAPHWHYISFGLSDLHGDGRVHVRNESTDLASRSGMGFELTFRLLKTEAELREQLEQPQKQLRPPTWPANLLQAIARYCFQTGNSLCVGDNIPWRKSLDDSVSSRLQNILIAHDPQLGCLETPFGCVDFCQIVAVTEEEIEQANRWNGKGVLNFLREDPKTGGEWLITDMQRRQSVFELFPETLANLQDDLEKQGSDLAGVNAEFTFREINADRLIKEEKIDSSSLNKQCETDVNNKLLDEEIKLEDVDNKTSNGNGNTNDNGNFLQTMSMSSNSLQKSCPLEYQPQAPNCIQLDGIEITLAPYAAKFLLLAIKDRIRHGRHFTFKAQHLAMTLVAESVTGTAVSKQCPYGVIGYWIQVLIPDDLVPHMIDAFQNANLEGTSEVAQKRLEFEWHDKKLKIIVDTPCYAHAPCQPQPTTASMCMVP